MVLLAKPMNLLVTGALGHIGSRLIRELPVGVFDTVYLVDNLSTQRYPALFKLPSDVRFRFVEADIVMADLERQFEGVDVVVHLAAITNAQDSFKSPEQTALTNFKGTERVARACLATGSKLLFVSSTSVYGVQRAEVDEDCPSSQLLPQSPYAETKLKAEALLHDLGRCHRLRFITCRFGTVFGVSPGMRFHTAVNRFCWQAVMGQPVTVWRTALHQERPYLDVVDAVDAIKFIVSGDLFDGRIYNVVTTNATVRGVLDIIERHVPDVSVQYVDAPIMNQLSYKVATRRFVGAGFQFKGSLEQGIGETIDLLRGAYVW